MVKARGREWVVLPGSEDNLLRLRPLAGTDDEITGIYLPLEPVESATFDLPDPKDIGDHRSCRLLRDAIRLGFRSSAGPFRSFGHIAVDPRPYQLVPLLMALKLDPVRLLIADDVGIGKTIEAAMIARELMDRGEIRRMAVLCPPHLAEQWQAELAEKFHIAAELVLPGTVRRLENGLGVGTSLFDVYPFVIVSMDYIKSDRRRDEFIRTCPEMVIVDEAHSCAHALGSRSRKQRYQLISQICAHPERHVILVTATPHTGKEDTFRSLLAFLNPSFSDLPDDLSGEHNLAHRKRLAAHFIQRRRGDIRSFMDSQTPFPERWTQEESYHLTPEYRALFQKVLQYARETVRHSTVAGSTSPTAAYRQRIRWWSVLGLLRTLGSSPAAASATLRSRAANLDAQTEEDVDEIGRRTILDMLDDASSEGIDLVPGSDIWPEDDAGAPQRRKLLEMARQAEKLTGDNDAKLVNAARLIRQVVQDGWHPVVFCRYIHTAEYVARHLRQHLRNVEVAAVTGLLPPAEREQRVRQLSESPNRILVCTDCLSEGINLQAKYDTVIHYDLSWNPTVHEQREGRVDRFGQPRSKIRAITYYGTDNQIDGIVLDVLIRKHRAIRKSLGIHVAVPEDVDKVMEAIMEGLLLKENKGPQTQLLLPLKFKEPKLDQFLGQWDKAARQEEKRSQTIFAQRTIKVDEVSRELAEAREAVGAVSDIRAFFCDAVRLHEGTATVQKDSLNPENPAFVFDFSHMPASVRDRINADRSITARFLMPVDADEVYLTRTHPLVENLAAYVFNSAIDPTEPSRAKRCGAIRTSAVSRRTTLMLVRMRYHLATFENDRHQSQLAEECQLVGFEGAPAQARWLDEAEAAKLLAADPADIIYPDQAVLFIQRVIEGYGSLSPYMEQLAHQRGRMLLTAHQRVREEAKIKGRRYTVTPQLPPDVLGIYVLLPVLSQGEAS
jgi:superfamily II DNA or RNA helicase